MLVAAMAHRALRKLPIAAPRPLVAAAIDVAAPEFLGSFYEAHRGVDEFAVITSILLRRAFFNRSRARSRGSIQTRHFRVRPLRAVEWTAHEGKPPRNTANLL